MNRQLIAAQGKAFELLATLPDRAGVASASEFGNMMAALSDLEDDPSQSAIVVAWADVTREAVDLKE